MMRLYQQLYIAPPQTNAGNGKIALEQFPLIKPDLVLLDINIPGYYGFEVSCLYNNPKKKMFSENGKHIPFFHQRLNPHARVVF